MIPVAAFLERVGKHCRAGEPLAPGDGMKLALAIDDLISGAQPTLDAALGLPHRRGGRSLATISAKSVRDDLIRQCAATYYRGSKLTERARAISSAAAHYRVGSWRADRTNSEAPKGERGIYFRIFRMEQSVPRWRRVVEILKLQRFDDFTAIELCESSDEDHSKPGEDDAGGNGGR